MLAFLLDLIAPTVPSHAASDVPNVTPIAEAALTQAFAVDPDYASAARRPAQLAILGALQIELPDEMRIVAGHSLGYLPMVVQLGSGRCFLVAADMLDSRLQNPSVRDVNCDAFRPRAAAQPQAPRPDLKFISSAWSFTAWADERDGSTVISQSVGGKQQIFFITTMSVVAMGAMDGPDTPQSNVTLVGTLGGRTLMVVLSLTY